MTDPRPALADTHCHLTLPEFREDVGAVIERAREAGIGRILVPGIDLATSRSAVALAEAEEGVYAAVGIHPHDSQTYSDAAESELRGLASSDRVVAIGEIGLDYYRDRSPRPAQREAFRAQLALATDLGLPVIVHNRESTADVMADLLEHSGRQRPELAGRVGVLHAFSAGLEEGRQAAEAGYFLGVAGPLTYPNAEARRSITAALPLDRLVLETDAPYLTPHPARGSRNEPAQTRRVAERLAALFDVSLGTVARATSVNAARLFGWDHGIDNGHIL
jgi:TatD DNase family protein